MHPSADIAGTKSDKLSGRLIILGVTGSIAAVETVKLAHELIRHGAEVIPVMTPAAARIIHPDALWAATGNKPILELTGDVEHVSYCGEVEYRADLLLIAPATANTISKIASGIDDTTVTTFATTALGSDIPIMIVPAMHRAMFKNRFVIENMEKLEQSGADIEFIGPVVEEGKAKIADNVEIVARVISRLWRSDLEGKRVLVVAGSTAEPVDDFRVLTNRSSGKMGLELATCAFERGADVTLWYGQSPAVPPSYIHTERFQSVEDLLMKLSFLDFDIIIVCAAIADYTPEKQSGKIASGQKELSISLKPTVKVLGAIKHAAPETYLVGFKAEYDVAEPELVEKAFSRLEQLKLDMIVANDLKEVTEDSNHVYIIRSNRERAEVEGPKADIATAIFDEIIKDMAAREGFDDDI